MGVLLLSSESHHRSNMSRYHSSSSRVLDAHIQVAVACADKGFEFGICLYV